MDCMELASTISDTSRGGCGERPLSQFLFVLRRWEKRGQKTSVEHFSDYLEGARFIHHHQRVIRPYRLLRWIARQAGHDRYTSISAGLEASCLWQMLRHRPRMVHFLYGEYDLHYTAFLGRLLNIPVAASFHNPPEELARRLRRPRFLRALSGVVILGRNQESYFGSVCPDVPRRFIPLGVDAKFFSPGASNGPVGRPQLLLIGVHLRDWQLTKRVLEELHGKIPELRVQTCIPREHTSCLPEGNWLVNKHPVTDLELRELYRSSTLMFYSPKDCVASNAVVEALACGVPIVSPRVGAIGDYVGASQGFLHEPHDTDGMINSTMRLVREHRLRSEMSSAARARGLSLDWNNIRDQYLDYYRELGFHFEKPA